MTLLAHVLLEIHCISYIIFCHPEGSAAAFWSICVTVTVKQDPTCSSVLCKSCCCCVQQRYGAWKTWRLITVVVQLDHVLTSWMCVAYEKTDRGLHRHISLYGGTRTWGMFKQRQTGWAKQIVWLLVGDCMHCIWITKLPGLKVHETNARYDIHGTH